ncbi:MAG: 3-deoxy-7-phosphoheptulonate synthase [Planctomycetota bacterium]|nr:MAG: 3-deoxy-7-phosphoheptulonate synthase [Planctomycetota bacterium]
MILLLQSDASAPQRSRLQAALSALGLSADAVRLGERHAMVLTSPTDLPADSLARLEGVERVLPLEQRTSLVSETFREGGTTVSMGTARFGGGWMGLIAGPCTVESEEALEQIARLVKEAGACALRGGVFKVRTSPHSYQGGGLDALQRMHRVSRRVGLPFLTEFTDPRQVSVAGELVDGVQIGARHMQNFPLLTEVAALGKPIMLKRHMGAGVDEWLSAAEYILKAGNEQVVLCERGVRSPDRHVRFLLDVSVVPYLKSRIGLPVLVDPSHAAGDWRLVPALAKAAVAAGADGLLIEAHPAPESTRCDASQALPPADLRALMTYVRELLKLDGRRLSDGALAPSADDQPSSPRAASA